ncbi:hypothetical protein AC789_1c20950 [Escherichia coli]|nr:hypothetical protein AC789_1c20950 [Escherichia coli]
MMNLFHLLVSQCEYDYLHLRVSTFCGNCCFYFSRIMKTVQTVFFVFCNGLILLVFTGGVL